LIFEEFDQNDLSDNFKQAKFPGFPDEDTDLDFPAPRHTAAVFHCRECGSPNISIYYKNDYYYQCGSCGNVMLVTNIGCLTCGQQLKLTQDENRFFFQCKTCGTARLFITDPVEARKAPPVGLL
jgi:DNA-directed RNA polymerase subunit RPC12/RpoP